MMHYRSKYAFLIMRDVRVIVGNRLQRYPLNLAAALTGKMVLCPTLAAVFRPGIIACRRPQNRHSFLSGLAYSCFRVSSRDFQLVCLWPVRLLNFRTRLTSAALSPVFISRAWSLADSAALHMSMHLSSVNCRSCSSFSLVVSSLIPLDLLVISSSEAPCYTTVTELDMF